MSLFDIAKGIAGDIIPGAKTAMDAFDFATNIANGKPLSTQDALDSSAQDAGDSMALQYGETVLGDGVSEFTSQLSSHTRNRDYKLEARKDWDELGKEVGSNFRSSAAESARNSSS
ncbi:MAG: hypothetical protein JJU21_16770 [Salinarimonas sp.]|nr:hypothetical protein [Salinarimonas sp.]